MRAGLIAVAVLVWCGCDTPPPSKAPAVGQSPWKTPASSGETALQPLMGGSLLITADGKHALATDASLDRLHFVDLETDQVLRLALPEGSVPTRAVEVSPGRFLVVLRGLGQVAVVVNDALGLSVRATFSVCGEPRGITLGVKPGQALVACGTGELVNVTETGVVARERVQPDLRDAVVVDGQVWVSTFKSAQLVSPDGATVHTLPSAMLLSPFAVPRRFEPSTAWRAVATGTEVVMVHHQALSENVTLLQLPIDAGASESADAGPSQPGDAGASEATEDEGPPSTCVGYGCGSPGPGNPDGDGGLPGPVPTPPCVVARSIVTAGLSVVDLRGHARFFPLPDTVLPVDVAVSPTRQEAAVAAPARGGVVHVDLTHSTECRPLEVFTAVGEVTGVGYLPSGFVVAHVQAPAQLVFLRAGVILRRLPLEKKEPIAFNLGRQLFHRTTASGVACASCHPEGGEDGRAWLLEGARRRTQSLRGGLTQTAPFHWQGEHAQLADVLADTFTQRMGGGEASAEETASLARWLDRLEAPQPLGPSNAAGREVFERLNCQSCHGGPLLTNNATVDVGTGGPFQVPSLHGLSRRGPWMHDGCATTLAKRFEPECGGARHGDLSQLGAGDLAALLGYLESL